MKLIERQDCVLGNSRDLETLHSLPDFPVFMGCVDHPPSDDLVANQTWEICRSTGVLQLKYLIPLEILYQAQHDAGVVGKIWMNHHSAFSSFIRRINPTNVLELGGAHGILAKEYKRFSNIPWAILEPNPSPVEGCEARFIKGFFDGKFSCEEAFDTVVHSHVFEHIYEPDQFMRHLAGLMAEGKHLIFSLPNMQVMLERKYTNGINFEHTVFLTEPYVEFLLAKHGFRLLTREYFMEDHSIFYGAVRDTSVKPLELPRDLYERNKRLYMDYVHYHEALIKDLNRKIRDSTQPVYLFGAHIFAQYLIAFGLDTSRIVSLLDNDPKKQGKRLYGTALTVASPFVLKQLPAATVILKAGVYNEEIKRQIHGQINDRVQFLE